MKPKPPTEDQESASFVAELELYPMLRFSHIANENKASDPKQAAIRGTMRKRMGVRAGVPDYIIVYQGRLLFIEMKRRGSVPSDVSPEQRNWLATLGAVPGVMVAVCRGADEAMAVVKEFMRAVVS